jgi:hypothetical protein
LQALIVAGASGAGKSTFLEGLYSGDLAPDLRAYLPSDADGWPLVSCSEPEQWQRFVSGDEALVPVPGIVVHHDITCSWRKHRHEPADDPFWQILHRCDRVTLVVMQLSPRRLRVQWSLARLGMHPWKVRARQHLAVLAWRVLRGIRLLRRSRHPDEPIRMRYPRPLRFLKRVDRKLRTMHARSPGHFDFYRQSANIQQMMATWSDMVEGKMKSLPVTRIEIVPVSRVAADAAPNWRVRSIRQIRAPSVGRLAVVPA